MSTLITRRGGIQIVTHEVPLPLRTSPSMRWETVIEPTLEWYQKPESLRPELSSTTPSSITTIAIKMVDKWLGHASDSDLESFWSQIEASTLVRAQRSLRLRDTGEITYGYPLPIRKA